MLLEIETVLVLISIPLLVYISYVLIKKNDLVYADTYSHLRVAEEIHDFRGIIPFYKSYFPNKKIRYTYPPMVHIILAVLQKKTSLTFRRTLSIWLNLLVAIIFAFILYSVFDFSSGKVALACGLYLINSMHYFETNVITPRFLGILFFLLAGVGVAQFYAGNTAYWPFILIGSTGLFLSHRMGVQILLFFGVVYTIVLLTLSNFCFYWLWIFLSASFAAALLLTQGQGLYVLKDHIKRIWLHIKTGNQEDGGKKIGSPFLILRKNPLVLLFLFSLYKMISGQNSWDTNSPLFVIFIICCVILFLSLFWVWGSGERHIIFMSPFLLVLYFSQEPISKDYLILLIPVLILIVIKILYSIWLAKEKGVDREWEELASSIKNEKGDKLLVLPEISIPYLTYTTKKIIFSGAHDSSAVTFNRVLLKRRLNEHTHIKNQVEGFNSDLILLGDSYRNPPLSDYLKANYSPCFHKNHFVLWKKRDR